MEKRNDQLFCAQLGRPSCLRDFLDRMRYPPRLIQSERKEPLTNEMEAWHSAFSEVTRRSSMMNRRGLTAPGRCVSVFFKPCERVASVYADGPPGLAPGGRCASLSAGGLALPLSGRP